MKRRELLKALALTPLLSLSARSEELITRQIGSSGERLPAVGLGTYQAFTALTSNEVHDRLLKVLTLFHREGGRVIDNSPMYGPAEATVGTLLPKVAGSSRRDWFLATKVWTDGESQGRQQMAASAKKMGHPKIDLMQIHNLRDWKTHLPTIRRLKEQGKIRYIGVTTWGGNSHQELLRFMETERPDFVQFTYSLASQEAEKRLLPKAEELGIATLINRPFEQGSLFRATKGRALPNWVGPELGIKSWAQLFLKFVLADPRVTCVIPATSKPKHLLDNMAAGRGPLPNRKQLRRIRALL
jgi:diketogulonate reductase-like aldo/keto reductase